MITEFRNYQRYTKDGNRLAIFGKKFFDTKMLFFVLKCSKHDKFNKNVAVQVYKKYISSILNEKIIYNNIEYHPIVYTIPISDGLVDKPKMFFQKHCRENFYKSYEIRMRIKEGMINPLVTIDNKKMSKYASIKYLSK